MSTKIPASTPEEREKYAKIEWQYSPAWMRKNVTQPEPGQEAPGFTYPDWVQFDEKGNTRGRKQQS
jgi:hypothetical protein